MACLQTQHPAAAAEAPANAPTATAGPAVASAAKVGNKVEASEGAQVPSRQAATVAEPSSRQAAAAARAEERHSATSTDANAAPAAKVWYFARR